MRGLVVDRRKFLWTCAGLVAAMAGFAVWYLQPDRSLRRAWESLVDAVETRRTAAVRAQLAVEYTDRWGYSYETLPRAARSAFAQFQRLELVMEDVQVRRADEHATITARIRLRAEGSAAATEARLAVNSLFTPFTFEWQRQPGFPWSWKLVTFDHPELPLRHLQPGAGVGLGY